jgi:glycosyltransferase involved in cell wall biosynthesis
MSMKLPTKLSIITPSYNQGQFLEETILSVLNQKYPNLEYIIIDGGSKDNSVEIIKRYEDRLTYWVSEPDRGQVHAINKGLAKATGEIFAFINSDDLYLPGVFSEVLAYFQEHTDCEWLCGDTVMFGEGHRTELFQAVVPKSAAHALSWAAHCPQPGMFWKRQLVASGFKEEWRYDFDHDLYIRLLLAGHKCHHLALPFAAYRLHPTSKTVAEGSHFDGEFELLAQHYEAQLQGGGRRWCKATRYLRQAYKLGQENRSVEGAKWLLRALLTHPESLIKRPFWGTFRSLLKNI